MGTPASPALDPLTDEVDCGLRPGDRVMRTSRVRLVAAVSRFANASEAGTCSAPAVGVPGLSPDRSLDDAATGLPVHAMEPTVPVRWLLGDDEGQA